MENEIDLDELNDSELRELCYDKYGKRPFILEDRESLLSYLREEVEPKENPVDLLRVHQITFLSDHWDTYTTIQCHTNCFAHDDVQVMECQVSNRFWLHPILKKEK